MLSRLTLDQLRVLVAIADSGTFSGAARRLGRVQSAISQSTQALEANLGLTLFDRAGKTPQLTDAGRAILEDARHLLRNADMIQSHAESLATDIEPQLTIAVDQIVPFDPLTESLMHVGEIYQTLSITVFSESSSRAEQRLHQGGAQLAIYAPAVALGAGLLNTEFLVTLPVTPVVAVGHPLAKALSPIPRTVLEQHVQLITIDAYEVSAPVAGVIARQRIWAFSDLPTRFAHLLAGAGWGHLPLHMTEPYIASGKLKRLEIAGQRDRFLNVALHVAHEPGRPPGRAGRLLIDELRARLRRLEPINAFPHKDSISASS